MDKMSNGKYIIDECPECGGIFLDKHEIDTIKSQSFLSYIIDWFRRK